MASLTFPSTLLELSGVMGGDGNKISCGGIVGESYSLTIYVRRRLVDLLVENLEVTTSGFRIGGGVPAEAATLAVEAAGSSIFETSC